MSGPHARVTARSVGLTLVEVLVGLLILTTGLLAISAMVPTAYSNFSSSGSDTRALAFAQQRLDRLRALPYNDSSLSAGTYTDSGGNAPADSNYTRSYQVEVDTPVAGVKRLTVTVVLNPPGTITLIDGTGADTATVNGNAFLVTGTDTAAPTSTGACGTLGASRRGVSVNSNASLTALGNAVADNQEDNITGSGGTATQGSYANNGTLSVSTLQGVANALIPGATAVPGGSNSNDYGSAAAPGVFLASSNIKLLGNGKGYGVLIATAGFEMAGNYKWEGLIIVIGSGTASITGADSKLYGSLLVANTQGGATHLTVSGNGGAYFSTQALCRVQNMVPSSTVIAWEQVG